MRYTKKTMLITILLICAFTLFATNVFTAEWKVPADWKYLKFAGGAPAGSWTPLTAKICELINREIPGANASSTLGASYSNLEMVNQKKMEIAISLASAVAESYHGIDVGGLTKLKVTPNIRHIATMHCGAFHIYVPKKSSIKHLSEIATKPVRICVGSKASNTYAFNNMLLKLYGSSVDDLEARGGTAHKILYGQGVGMMKDGKVDLLAHHTGLRAAMVMDAASNPGIRFLEIEPAEKKMEIMDKMVGTVEVVIPKDMYPGIEKDYPTFGVPFPIVVNKDMPEELAYRLTKVIWENLEEIQSIGAFAKDGIKWENCFQGNTIPLHPGAERYYKEKGKTIPPVPDSSSFK